MSAYYSRKHSSRGPSSYLSDDECDCGHCKPHSSCGKGYKYRKCPPGPTGPAGPSIIVEGNTGTAMPDENGAFQFLGTSGIVTTGTGSMVTIDNLRDLSQYVVDSTNPGSSEYSTLEDAITAASADPNSDPANAKGVTILLKPGCYVLTNALANNRKLHIEGVSSGSDSAVLISGCAQSKGNKSWTHVTFSDPEGDYFLNDDSTHDVSTDNFCKCQFTENFRIRTANDRLRFRSVFFNYSQIQRDKLISTEGGIGQIDACWCDFFFCRFGGVDAPRFISLNSDSCDGRSRIVHSKFDGLIDGSSDHIAISVENQQRLDFQHNNVRYLKACPDNTFFFGKMHCPNPKAKLQVYHSSFISKAGPEEKLSVLGNLWSGDRLNAIRFHHTTIIAAHALNNNLDTVPEGQMGAWQFHQCTVEGVNPNRNPFYTKVNDKAQLFYNISATHTITGSPVAHFQLDQAGDGSIGELVMVNASAQDNSVNTPPWLQNNWDPNAITVKNYSYTRDGVNQSAGAVINDVALPTVV